MFCNTSKRRTQWDHVRPRLSLASLAEELPAGTGHTIKALRWEQTLTRLENRVRSGTNRRSIFGSWKSHWTQTPKRDLCLLKRLIPTSLPLLIFFFLDYQIPLARILSILKGIGRVCYVVPESYIHTSRNEEIFQPMRVPYLLRLWACVSTCFQSRWEILHVWMFGFTDRLWISQVQSWPLSHDNLHFSREVHEELVAAWTRIEV